MPRAAGSMREQSSSCSRLQYEGDIWDNLWVFMQVKLFFLSLSPLPPSILINAGIIRVIFDVAR